MSILERIDEPSSLKSLSRAELAALAREIRETIIEVVGRNGGHLSSNLGVVELTLALHRIFDSPTDAIVWDVGHQCYAHKLVTGRREDFAGLRRSGGISGFPKRAESCHDSFDTGHASTSISSALGLLEGRIRSGRPGKVVAVIGDGALTGGMAFEALSHAGHLGLPLIIVLNDNKMSISPNVGALSLYLSRLSATAPYQAFRTTVDRIVKGIPFIGPELFRIMYRGKKAVKALVYRNNFFSDLGFEYVGPVNGHDLPALLSIFEDVRVLGRPVVVHVLTKKGRGHEGAEEDPASFHGVAPPPGAASATAAPAAFAAPPGAASTAGAPGAAVSARLPGRQAASLTEAFGESLLALARRDPRVVAVTAAMAKGTGLEPLRRAFPQRCYDVGIAEEHAVTFAAGLAAGGLRPVVAIYSTFMQRAVDQVFHDLCLPGLPVTIVMDRAGAVGEDGETHQGIYDLALFRALPDLPILCPASAGELALCLDWAAGREGPAVIRYPKARCPAEEPAYAAPLAPGRGRFLRREGSRELLVALGGLLPGALAARELLAAEGAPPDLYSLRFASPLDREALLADFSGYERILFAEEGVAEGGVGQALAAMLGGLRAGAGPLPGAAADAAPRPAFAALGFPSRPCGQASREELLAAAGLDAAGIAAAVRALRAGLLR